MTLFRCFFASLSSGEFVGMVADNPEQKIQLKTFCAEIINDHETLRKEQAAYRDLPRFSAVDGEAVMTTYSQVKRDITEMVRTEIERMMDTPELNGLIIQKEAS